MERALHALGRLIEAEGPGSIAALLVETVPGTAGVIVPPPGWLAGLRALCDRWGIVLIFDEVMAGFGRTGDWFAFQNPTINPEGIVPDLITFAKGVNSGYVPAGGVIIPPAIAARVRRPASSRAGSPTPGTRSRWRRSWRPSTRCGRRASSRTPVASARRCSLRRSPRSPTVTR